MFPTQSPTYNWLHFKWETIPLNCWLPNVTLAPVIYAAGRNLTPVQGRFAKTWTVRAMKKAEHLMRYVLNFEHTRISDLWQYCCLFCWNKQMKIKVNSPFYPFKYNVNTLFVVDNLMLCIFDYILIILLKNNLFKTTPFITRSWIQHGSRMNPRNVKVMVYRKMTMVNFLYHL